MIEAPKRQRPAAEEQRHHHRGRRNHVGIFSEEKQRELHRAVFRVIATDEFGFRFRQVERRAVRFRKRCDHENDERNRRIRHHPAMRGLPRNNLTEIQITNNQQHRNDRHAHRNFIRNHLRARTDAAEHRILRVRRVTRQHDAVNAHRDDAKRVENADVQICDDHFLRPDVRAERNHRDRQHRRNHGHRRREEEINFLHARRRKIFLEHELQAVRERLENSKTGQKLSAGNKFHERRRGAVRADAILNPRGNFALGQHRIRDEPLHDADDNRDLDQAKDDEIPVHFRFAPSRRCRRGIATSRH